MAVNAIEPNQGARALSQIESDLLKAEAAFADADKRLDEAQRDRRAAIETIDRHQTEFDTAVSALRLRSTAGSRWRVEMGGRGAAPMHEDEASGEDALILQDEAGAGETGAEEGSAEEAGDRRSSPSNRSKSNSVSEEFDRLKTLVQSAGNDPGDASIRTQSTH